VFVQGLRYSLDNPGFGNVFFYAPKCPDRFWVQPNLLFSGHRRHFPGVKQPKREVERSPSDAEVKNGWSYASAPPMSLHGVCSDRFTCTFLRMLKESEEKNAGR